MRNTHFTKKQIADAKDDTFTWKIIIIFCYWCKIKILNTLCGIYCVGIVRKHDETVTCKVKFKKTETPSHCEF